MLFRYNHKVGYRLQENRPLAMTGVVYFYFKPLPKCHAPSVDNYQDKIMQIKTYINHEAKVVLSFTNYISFGWCRIPLHRYGCNVFFALVSLPFIIIAFTLIV